MQALSQTEFESLVAMAMDRLPKKYRQHIANVVFVVEDQPSSEQRKKLSLGNHQSLYGLYEGIPLPQRGAGYNLVLPDKITLFKQPLEASCRNQTELAAAIMHTLWHEVGHYFGLNHARIAELEAKQQSTNRQL